MRRLLLLTLVATGCGAAARPPAPAGPRVTEPFRVEHARLHEHLDHVEALIGTLATAAPDARATAQADVLAFFADHLLAHARWEEQALYPAVDRRASRGEPFTASMRFEHEVVARSVDELRAHVADPDPTAFARAADRLLGLVIAHFGAEEEVLLPVLDRTMTPAEYERELGAGHQPTETP